MRNRIFCYLLPAVLIVGLLGTSPLMKAERVSAQSGKTSFKFDFGPGKLAPGYRQVLPTDIYAKERGFGFEPGAALSGVDRGDPDALRGDFITSDKPFYFSVALPEGNYKVSV